MGKIFDTKESAIVREDLLTRIIEALEVEDIRVENGAVAIPVGEGFAKVTVTLPKGPRGGDGWDPIADAQALTDHKAVQATKKAEADRKKAEKIAKDEAKRKAKAEAEA